MNGACRAARRQQHHHHQAGNHHQPPPTPVPQLNCRPASPITESTQKRSGNAATAPPPHTLAPLRSPSHALAHLGSSPSGRRPSGSWRPPSGRSHTALGPARAGQKRLVDGQKRSETVRRPDEFGPPGRPFRPAPRSRTARAPAPGRFIQHPHPTGVHHGGVTCRHYQHRQHPHPVGSTTGCQHHQHHQHRQRHQNPVGFLIGRRAWTASGSAQMSDFAYSYA